MPGMEPEAFGFLAVKTGLQIKRKNANHLMSLFVPFKLCGLDS